MERTELNEQATVAETQLDIQVVDSATGAPPPHTVHVMPFAGWRVALRVLEPVRGERTQALPDIVWCVAKVFRVSLRCAARESYPARRCQLTDPLQVIGRKVSTFSGWANHYGYLFRVVNPDL